MTICSDNQGFSPGECKLRWRFNRDHVGSLYSREIWIVPLGYDARMKAGAGNQNVGVELGLPSAGFHSRRERNGYGTGNQLSNYFIYQRELS